MANLKLNQSTKPVVQDAQVVSTTEDTGPRAFSDTRAVARTGLLVLAVGFGGFLLWAGLAPLDEGVPTQGMVTLDTKRKTVQHLSGGIVKEVLVREGQHVKEGEPMLRLDGAAGLALLLVLLVQRLELLAVHIREPGRLVGAEERPVPVLLHALHEQVWRPQRVEQVARALQLVAVVLCVCVCVSVRRRRHTLTDSFSLSFFLSVAVPANTHADRVVCVCLRRACVF